MIGDRKCIGIELLN